MEWLWYGNEINLYVFQKVSICYGVVNSLPDLLRHILAVSFSNLPI